jgi:hypothetical protein
MSETKTTGKKALLTQAEINEIVKQGGFIASPGYEQVGKKIPCEGRALMFELETHDSVAMDSITVGELSIPATIWNRSSLKDRFVDLFEAEGSPQSVKGGTKTEGSLGVQVYLQRHVAARDITCSNGTTIAKGDARWFLVL